jgi:hypothetical protein
MSDSQDQAPQWRINRNLKHNGVRFAPPQVVSGFDEVTAAQLEAAGTITRVVAGEPVAPIEVKKDQAKVVSPAQQQAAAAGIQRPQVIAPADQPPTAPEAPLGGGESAPQDGLTDEERAVRDTANQVG